jgi:hypothetical protein
VATFDTVFIAAFTAPEDCDENIFSLHVTSKDYSSIFGSWCFICSRKEATLTSQ